MKLLAFFAHPDDETMLAGGTLALLAQAGVEIHYLCATRGEGGEVGEPPLSSQNKLGELRARELNCAVHALGNVGSLSFMDYLDPIVGPGDKLFPFMDDPMLLADQLIAFIKKLNIDLILTHGSNGEYGHPAHILCHKAAVQAVKKLEIKPALYTVQAIFDQHPKPRIANQDDLAELIIDVKPVLEQKTKAARCHLSQNALFIRRTSEDLGRPVTVDEVVMEVESLGRVFPSSSNPEKDQIGGILTKHLI